MLISLLLSAVQHSHFLVTSAVPVGVPGDVAVVSGVRRVVQGQETLCSYDGVLVPVAKAQDAAQADRQVLVLLTESCPGKEVVPVTFVTELYSNYKVGSNPQHKLAMAWGGAHPEAVAGLESDAAFKPLPAWWQAQVEQRITEAARKNSSVAKMLVGHSL